MPRPTYVIDVRLPTHAGKVPLRVYGDLAGDGNVLVWAHGGSWAHGSVNAWHPAYLALSRSLPLTLVALHYRSTYQAPFPAQLLDVRAALGAVRALTTGAVLAGGDSAGATLVGHAAACEHGLVDGQLLVYPPIDPTCASTTYDRAGGFPSRDAMRRAWRLYAGTSAPLGLARASPLAAGIDRGLPPTSLLVGAHDPVRGDVEAYGAQLSAAGVATRLEVRSDIGHGDFLRDDVGNAVHEWVAREARHHLSQTSAEGERR